MWEKAIRIQIRASMPSNLKTQATTNKESLRPTHINHPKEAIREDFNSLRGRLILSLDS